MISKENFDIEKRLNSSIHDKVKIFNIKKY